MQEAEKRLIRDQGSKALISKDVIAYNERKFQKTQLQRISRLETELAAIKVQLEQLLTKGSING